MILSCPFLRLEQSLVEFPAGAGLLDCGGARLGVERGFGEDEDRVLCFVVSCSFCWNICAQGRRVLFFLAAPACPSTPRDSCQLTAFGQGPRS